MSDEVKVGSSGKVQNFGGACRKSSTAIELAEFVKVLEGNLAFLPPLP